MVGLAALAGLNFWHGTFEPSLRNVTHGFPVYYVSARLIVEGRWGPHVYDDAWFNDEVMALTDGRVGEIFGANPPNASLLLLPLAGLDMAGARVAWLWLNLALLPAALGLIIAALGRTTSLVFSAGVLALAMVYAPLRENFRLGQAYVFLLLLLALAFWSLSRQRWALSGLALGTAAATKLSGLPLWLMLAVRGHWREIGFGALIGLGFVLTSIAVAGWWVWARYLSILPTFLAGTDYLSVLAFQTTPSFFQHLFVMDAHWNPHPVWHQPWLAIVLSVGVSGTALALTLWRGRRAEADLAFAAAATLGVVSLPLAEEYHYTLLLLPLAVMAFRLTRQKPFNARDAIWFVVAVLLLSVPWPYKSERLSDGWYALLAYPRLYGGWLVWGWLLKQMHKDSRATPSHA